MSLNESDGKVLYVKQVAALLGETDHTIRNWLRDFRQYIPTKKLDNGYNGFDEEAINVLKSIQRLSRELKYSTKQIDRYLATNGKEFASAESIASPALVNEFTQEITELKEMMQNQQQFNKSLVERLDAQQRFIEESLTKRDQLLMQTLQEMRESRLAIAAAQEEQTKKGFLARLFGK
ncbi:MerR family transcriptional regulator [Paenibacillus solisilvae]|uniref:MerR family transcriptional regulator n=1 Tax=Paenibacillus solisilvae TaxID=2486751 RepID=A0ABW0W8U4_9BACL